jgi:hypothetical protein
MALFPAPPRVTAPDPEAMVILPVVPLPMVKEAAVALPFSIVVAAVSEMLMPPMDSLVPFKFAVDAVFSVKFAVPVELGTPLGLQLLAVAQFPVPTFQVDCACAVPDPMSKVAIAIKTGKAWVRNGSLDVRVAGGSDGITTE